MILATGPFVHSIKLRLPPSVRTSKDELLHFVDNMPGNAELRIECMRFAPWPTKRDVKFGLLRKYRPSLKGGLANLEYVTEHGGNAKGYEGTWWHNMVKNAMGRFMVDNVVQDKSAAPGLWIKIWKQIPERGSQHDPSNKLAKEARKPVTMVNRPQRAMNPSVRPTSRPSSSVSR